MAGDNEDFDFLDLPDHEVSQRGQKTGFMVPEFDELDWDYAGNALTAAKKDAEKAINGRPVANDHQAIVSPENVSPTETFTTSFLDWGLAGLPTYANAAYLWSSEDKDWDDALSYAEAYNRSVKEPNPKANVAGAVLGLIGNPRGLVSAGRMALKAGRNAPGASMLVGKGVADASRRRIIRTKSANEARARLDAMKMALARAEADAAKSGAKAVRRGPTKEAVELQKLVAEKQAVRLARAGGPEAKSISEAAKQLRRAFASNAIRSRPQKLEAVRQMANNLRGPAARAIDGIINSGGGPKLRPILEKVASTGLKFGSERYRDAVYEEALKDPEARAEIISYLESISSETESKRRAKALRKAAGSIWSPGDKL